jgi:hypothetical protein
MYRPMIGCDANGKVLSRAQGQIGSKIELCGIVTGQHSVPVSTPHGTVYSNIHILEDAQGNLYKYKGSSLFPKGHKVHLIATVKGYFNSDDRNNIVTIIKAPKLVR